MKTWTIIFEQNGGEYQGHMFITCDELEVDWEDERTIFADGVRIELDERIIEVV